MTINNNAKLIRRNILTRMVKIALEQENYEDLDRIPLKMRPRNGEHVRCCVFRDRALIKYKMMAIYGFDANNDEDELTSLATYHKASTNGEVKDSPFLRVVHEACSACQKNNYIVTNMCQGCVSRPCMLNCPKNAIHFEGEKAKISPDACVNCGICQKVCPFHAIIYSPVPCEEVCPVNAIQKDEQGKEVIDLEKCIFCGKCLEACPFGAIVEKSEVFEVISKISEKKEMIAMVAPSIAGQFREPVEKIYSGLKKLGFSKIVEVASGAEITTRIEAEEFAEKLEAGESMTTSCCRAYTNLVNKHHPDLQKFVSTTLTPMEYTAREVRKKYPDATSVFISPCISKKDEAANSENVDYVINFEEFGTWLVAAGIEISECEEYYPEQESGIFARNFARAGGVSEAVANQLPGIDFENIRFDGIDKFTPRKLKASLKGKKPAFIEVMSCEGGCIGGCNTIADTGAAKRQMDKSYSPKTMEMNH